jgi:hypothetical protein
MGAAPTVWAQHQQYGRSINSTGAAPTVWAQHQGHERIVEVRKSVCPTVEELAHKFGSCERELKYVQYKMKAYYRMKNTAQRSGHRPVYSIIITILYPLSICCIDTTLKGIVQRKLTGAETWLK